MGDQITICTDSFDIIEKILSKKNVKKIFLITGKKSFFKSGAETELAICLKNKHVTRFWQFDVNPCLEDAIKGINLIRKENYDVIIAVGGGSVIDMAKLINALFLHPDSDFETIIKYNNSQIYKKLPILALPTTAGSGSEATRFAVVYIGKKKYSLAHDSMLPDYAIINPKLTCNLPQYIAASSSIDALAQAVESYWAVGSTPKSRYFAANAIKLILPSIKEAVLENKSSAKNRLAIAANYAGKAINISRTTAPHAISYTITTDYKLAHGHAVGVLMGKFFTLHSEYEKKNRQLFQTMKELYALFDCKDSFQCSVKWDSLLTDIGLETNLEKIGIRHDADKIHIANNVNIERLKNHPVQLSAKQIIKLLS